MRLRRCLVGSLLAAGCVAPALAQVTAGATLGGLNYTLFDLDATDALQPSLTWGVPPGSTSSSWSPMAMVSYGVQGERTNISHGATGYAAPGEPLIASYDRYHGSGTIGLTGRGAQGLDQQLASVIEVPNLAGYTVNYTTTGESDPLFFTLGARTRVTFTASLDAWSQIADSTTHFGLVQMIGSLSVRNLANHYVDYDSDTRFWQADTRNGLPEYDQTVQLSVSYDNAGTAPVYAVSYLSLRNNGWSIPVSAVPEPASVGMLLAGGLLLGLRSRLRGPLNA